MIPDKLFIPMTFEYGTVNNLTTVGSIKALRTMIMENQGWHHGYRSEKVKEEITHRFREIYYPSSERWRSQIIRRTREVLGEVVERYTEL